MREKIKKIKKKISNKCCCYVNGTKGVMTLFLAFLVSPILSMSLLLVETARYQDMMGLVKEVSDLSAFSTISHYDEFSDERFGLLSIDQTIDINGIYEQYMKVNRDAIGEGANISLSTAKGVFPLSNEEIFRHQIFENAEYSVPLYMAEQKIDMSEIFSHIQGLMDKEKLAGIKGKLESIKKKAELTSKIVKEATEIKKSWDEYQNALSDFTNAKKNFPNAFNGYIQAIKDEEKARKNNNDAQNSSEPEEEIIITEDMTEEEREEAEKQKEEREKKQKEEEEKKKKTQKALEKAQEKTKEKKKILEDSKASCMKSAKDLKDYTEEILNSVKKIQEAYDEYKKIETPENKTAVDKEVKQTENWMGKIAEIGKKAKEIDLSGGEKKFSDITNLEKIIEKLGKINIDDLKSTSKLSEYISLDFSTTLSGTISEIIKIHGDAESGLKALKEKFEQIKDIVTLPQKIMEIDSIYDPRLNAQVSNDALYVSVKENTSGKKFIESVSDLQDGCDDLTESHTLLGALKGIGKLIKALIDFIGGIITWIVSLATTMADNISSAANMELFQKMLLYGYGVYNLPNRCNFEDESSIYGYKYSKIFEASGGNMDKKVHFHSTITRMEKCQGANRARCLKVQNLNIQLLDLRTNLETSVQLICRFICYVFWQTSFQY